MDIGDLALITDLINMTNKPYDGDQSFRTDQDIKDKVFSSSSIYDKEMVDLTRQSFIDAGLRLNEGYYCYYALPNFESPSDFQIMHDLGATTVGASTLPEQIACYLRGMRRVIVSSAISPSSGMSDQEISGKEDLECGRKCVISFAKLLPVLIAKLKDEMFLNKRPNMLLNTKSQLDNINNQRQPHIDTQEVAQKIANAVRSKVGDKQIQKSFWLMSDQLYQQFIDEHKNDSENPIYFINLSKDSKFEEFKFYSFIYYLLKVLKVESNNFLNSKLIGQFREHNQESLMFQHQKVVHYSKYFFNFICCFINSVS